jgi:cytosine/adenosine deaminase-related metal-dependent hydrolase
MATVYFAKWLLLPSFEILTNGVVSVENGRIIDVGTRGRVKRGRDDRIVNLGDLLLLPGLINIHTHLEENALRDMPRAETESFASWSAKRVTRLKLLPDATVENSVRLGARELLTHGITTVADCSRRGISPRVLSAEPVRSFIIHETHPETPEEEELFITSLSARIDKSFSESRFGIGPYALFSLSPRSHSALVDFARTNGYLWSTHVAESAEELQAFSDQTGDLFFHISRKKPWPFGKVTKGPMDYALAHSLIPPKAVCFHCNYVNGRELEQLAALQASVALCFQYSKEAGHKSFPLDVAMNRGVRLCAATESLSCGRSMNLFDELFCARQQYPHIPTAEMLRWITLNPAAALGVADRLGSLSPGKCADIIGLRFGQEPGNAILDELILSEPEVRLVMINGEEILADF